jgi:hypothetical protein
MYYTIPRLHAFGNDTKHGDCVPGTQATISSCSVGNNDYGMCGTGSVATSGCETGNSTTDSCYVGNDATYWCSVGNRVSGTHCD